MNMSLSEKAIGRGYFVCKKIQVRNDKVYLNSKHERLIHNSVEVGLKSPLNADQIESLINALHKASGVSDCEIIVYITAGNGDQGIYIDNTHTAVYAVAIEHEIKSYLIDELV